MRPENTLIICSDQHSAAVMGCGGNSRAYTPNIDALAARGTVFENAYTATPLCVPARAALATGLYPFQGGFWDNAHPYSGRQMSWGRRLREAGVAVTALGKLHFKDAAEQTFPGQRITMNVKNGAGDVRTACRNLAGSAPRLRRQIQAAGAGDSDYMAYDRTIARTAAEYLKDEAARSGEPWCLYVGFTTPHNPLTAPAELLERWRPFGQFAIPPEWRDPSPLHPALRRYKEMTQIESGLISDEEFCRAAAAYYALVSFTDSQVGVVLSALREAGLEDSTRVIYMSDHGDSAGAHGLFFKCNMYDGAVRVPMIAAGPGLPAGRRVPALVSGVDLYPTMLSFYGLEKTEAERALPGVSLTDTLAGRADPDRSVLCEYHASGYDGSVYMLRQGRYKLIRYTGYDRRSLFDLAADPGEEHDLGGQAEYAGLTARLDGELERLCAPEAADAAALASQRALIESMGGLSAVLAKGPAPFSAVPEGMGMQK